MGAELMIVDDQIASLIYHFNSHGYYTVFSCEGHWEGRYGTLPWIGFDVNTTKAMRHTVKEFNRQLSETDMDFRLKLQQTSYGCKLYMDPRIKAKWIHEEYCIPVDTLKKITTGYGYTVSENLQFLYEELKCDSLVLFDMFSVMLFNGTI